MNAAGTEPVVNGVPAPPVDLVETRSGGQLREDNIGERDIGGISSPSQINCWYACSARWWFRYGLHEAESRGAALAIGSAVDEAFKENYRQKIHTKLDLPLLGVLAIYKDAFAREADLCTWLPADKPAELELGGAQLIKAGIEKFAPFIEPAAVDQEVTGVIGGVNVKGFEDVRDVAGVVYDLKTSLKKPSGIRPDYRLQLGTYGYLDPEASGKLAIHTLVKTKTVQAIAQPFKLEPHDVLSLETLYPLAQEGMKSGLYYPSRNSLLCSRKYCSYWKQCEDSYGGRVKGGEDE